MFSFLKPKTRLIDCLPSGYTDIHSHLLPGIDDGAKTIEDSRFLLENMIGFGFTKIITTPHTMAHFWDNTPETITNALHDTTENLNSLTDKVQLKAASEYMMDDAFVQLFQNEKLLTLKDTFVLVEMSYLNPPIQLLDILFDLQVAGYIPVLAHPERYMFYHNNLEHYYRLKKAGCYFQLNMLSATGYYGKEVAQTANELLKRGLIDFLGSDFHHKQHINAFHNPIVISEIKALKTAASNNSRFSAL